MSRPNAQDARGAKSIFTDALALIGAAREAYVVAACDGRPELEAEVRSLLAHATGMPLPTGGGVVQSGFGGFDSSSMVGRRVSEFEIVRRIADGGMGRVYEARQSKPERSVALKFMRTEFATEALARRFALEIELLGKLNHPVIAAIHAADTVDIDGQWVPYFAMELVAHARPLTVYADDTGLSTRARVELFVSVCDGIGHAHRLGVIHRDLKPGNILVAPSGAPKVIDFGVARALDSDVARATQHTRMGELVGTLAYMSPEQCGGDPNAIGTGSDVYSLGVVLYELLCGGLPYELGALTIAAASRVICEQAPVPPGVRRRELKGDLEAVLLQALAKDPGRRYANADELAADLRRWLRGEIVTARPPTWWTHMAHWVARHPIYVTAGACAVLVLVTLSSMWFTLWWLGRQPGIVRVDWKRGKAVLESRAGFVLHEWPEAERSTVNFAQLAERDPTLGGGRIALVGSHQPLLADETSGVVHAYDIDAPDKLLWSTARSKLVLPADEPTRPQARFGLTSMSLADLLPAAPGVELLAIQRLHPFSATALRVFDLSGELRFAAWHDGSINGAVWLSAAQILMAVGLEEPMWSERGVAFPASRPRYPSLILGLRVTDGVPPIPEWLLSNGRLGRPEIAWVKWLGPCEALGALGLIELVVQSDVGTLDRRAHASILVRASPQGVQAPTAAFQMIVDADGQEVLRTVYDDYREWCAAGIVPEDRGYRLMDYAELPPLR